MLHKRLVNEESCKQETLQIRAHSFIFFVFFVVYVHRATDTHTPYTHTNLLATCMHTALSTQLTKRQQERSHVRACEDGLKASATP
jgi:hypothetical protein